jgi:hypothetical protein
VLCARAMDMSKFGLLVGTEGHLRLELSFPYRQTQRCLCVRLLLHAERVEAQNRHSHAGSYDYCGDLYTCPLMES